MAKDAYYFPHDYNAHNDPKLIRLAMIGWDLVGIYWAIIGIMHEQGGWLDVDPAPLAFALRTNNERITTVIRFPDLFKFDGNKFTTDRVLLNIAIRLEKSHKARESIQVRWNKEVTNDTNVIRTNYERNTRKERKGKKIYSVFTPPTIDQVIAYKTEISSPVDPQNFLDFYTNKKWKVGKESMVDWKAAFRRAKNWDSNAPKGPKLMEGF